MRRVSPNAGIAFGLVFSVGLIFAFRPSDPSSSSVSVGSLKITPKFATLKRGAVGSEGQVQFTFKNNSTRAIRIDGINADCSCTDLSWKQATIAAGETRVLTATVKRADGKRSTKLYISSPDVPDGVILQIDSLGYSLALMDIEAEYVEFLPGAENELSATFTVKHLSRDEPQWMWEISTPRGDRLRVLDVISSQTQYQADSQEWFGRTDLRVMSSRTVIEDNRFLILKATGLDGASQKRYLPFTITDNSSTVIED